MNDAFEHELKKWEIKYGYISVKAHKDWRDFFHAVLDKYFDLTVFGECVFQRKIDGQGRIYVGPASLKPLRVGETIFITRDKKGNFHVKRKK
jgi:hypothetical protein